MSLIRYEPWSLLSQLQKELLEGNRLLKRESEHAIAETSGWPSAWIPPVDIEEKKDRYLVKVDLPGVNPNEIEISMEGNVLTIRGERENERKEEDKDKAYSRVERVYGKFYRMFTLPADTIDSEHISARSDHGVLEIVIPKKEQAKPRKINVNVTLQGDMNKKDK